jgi:hypothetical protein
MNMIGFCLAWLMSSCFVINSWPKNILLIQQYIIYVICFMLFSRNVICTTNLYNFLDNSLSLSLSLYLSSLSYSHWIFTLILSLTLLFCLKWTRNKKVSQKVVPKQLYKIQITQLLLSSGLQILWFDMICD